MGRNRKVLTAMLGIVVTGVIGAACGGPGPAATAGVPKGAAAAPADAQTVEIVSTTTDAGAPPATQRMVYDFRHRVGEIFSTAGPAGQADSEVIVDQSNVYTSLSDITTGLSGPVPLPAGKEWLVQSVRHGAAAQGLVNLLDPTSPAANVAMLVRQLAPLVASVRQAGRALIAGVHTTRYDLTINAQRVKPVLGVAPLAPSGPVRVWADSEGRVRRIEFAYLVPHIGEITEMSDYTHFGLPVHVTIPPASEVETAPQLQRDMCPALRAGGEPRGVPSNLVAPPSSVTCPGRT
jgi:hypothetical protein